MSKWPRITAIMLAVVLIAVTLLPIGLGPSSDGILSIHLRQASANPDWLSGYGYRKEITIDGSTAGVQTDYQMRLNVYKDYPPVYDNGVTDPLFGGIYPAAYYYNGKTYVVWQGEDLDPYIDCYTHSTSTWYGAVKVGTNPLSGDSHGAPCVVVDDSGYIHVFFGCHLTALKYAKSTNTEDISAWTAQDDVGSACAYPMVVKDGSGVIWLFVRELVAGINHEYWRNSSDYTSETQIIQCDDAADGVYLGDLAYDSTNGRVHFAWTYFDKSLDAGVGRPINVYHAYMNLSDEKMYAMDGTDLGTTITKAEADSNCIIVAETTYAVGYRASVKLDSDNYPYVFYTKNTAVGQKVYHIAWDGSSWGSENEITTITGTPHITSAVFITSGSDITAYIPISGDLEKWTWNGTSWSQDSTTMPVASFKSDGCVRCTNVQDADSLKVIFSDWDNGDYTNADLEVFCLDSSDNFVAGLEKVGLGGNCQDDFDDIRFTQSDGSTELDYWVEDKTDADDTKVWIEFNSIVASPSSSNFYIYYSNSGASAGSSGANTFPSLFDDFDGDAEPPSGWSETQVGTLTWSDLSENSKYKVYNFQDSASEWHGNSIYKSVTPPTTFALVSKCIVVCSDSNVIPQHRTRLEGYKSSSNVFFVGFSDSSVSAIGGIASHITGTYENEGLDVRGGATYIFEIRRDGTNIKTYWNGNLQQTKAEAETLDEVRFNLVGGRSLSSSDPQTEIEYVFIRKYCDPEPTWGAFGSEEGYTPEITNTPGSNDFGVLAVNTASSTAINYFTIENTGTGYVDVTIQGTDLTGGDDTWDLDDSGSPGENIYGLYAGLDDDDDTFDLIIRETPTYNTLVRNLAESETQDWGIKIYMPTSVTDYDAQQMSGTITLVAYAVDPYEYKKPASYTDPNSEWNNETNTYDGSYNDQTTCADSDAGSADRDPWISFPTWQVKGYTYTETTLYVNWKTNGTYGDDEFAIQYTKNGGSNWYDLVALGVHNDVSIVTSSIALDANQDLTLVQVKLVYNKVGGIDTGITYVYDIWTRGLT